MVHLQQEGTCVISVACLLRLAFTFAFGQVSAGKDITRTSILLGLMALRMIVTGSEADAFGAGVHLLQSVHK